MAKKKPIQEAVQAEAVKLERSKLSETSPEPNLASGDGKRERSKVTETGSGQDRFPNLGSTFDEYVDGKREYAVVRDFVNKFSGKHCPIGSRVFLTDERAATLTELGCVALVPSRVIRRP
ncbi:MAG: hypothetical protein LBC59_09415 [Chitinispirillales bacterium]|jgi:hypothetical protein|nr:hypothetical protein [Chitinispirillales bacterium]